MRDPARIYPICLKLAEHWSKVPDMRLRQLIVNAEVRNNITSLFYLEDEDFLERLDNYFEEIKKGVNDNA